MPSKLTPDEEAKFQQWVRATGWHKEFKTRYGGDPNLDDPEYDYRAAYKAGLYPTRYEHDKGAYHWPSVTPQGGMLKGKNHPTAWMEGFMQETGVDPNAVGATKEDWDRYQMLQRAPDQMPIDEWARARSLQLKLKR
jgi:hypothetical protein